MTDGPPVNIVPVHWTDPRADRWVVDLSMARTDQGLRCVGVDLRAADGTRPVTASLLRELPLGRLVDEACKIEAGREALSAMDPAPLERILAMGLKSPRARAMVEQALAASPAERREAVRRLPEVLEGVAKKRGRPRTYGDEHYEKVARIYQEASERGSRSPTKDVAQHRDFVVTPAAAAKWVARARELGFLGPTTRGRPGGLR